jgi:regulatory protein
MAAENEADKARQSAYYILGVRDHTVAELREKLTKKEFSPESISHALGEMQRLKLVDDRAFARRWVERSLGGRPAGRRKVALELRRKGIAADLIDETLEEFADSLGSAEVAVEALRRQGWRYRRLDGERARRRMFGFLARRGFDMELARRAVDQVWKELEEDGIESD